MNAKIALGLLGAAVAAAAVVPFTGAQAEPKFTSVLHHKVKDIDGKTVDLTKYQGQVVMIVNVASRCGNTKQYAGLQSTYEKYKAQGFTILGFPANEFGAQEPGSDAEIKTFCSTKYNVSFPMFSKVVVKGDGQVPLYKQLTDKTANPKTGGDIEWNFAKFILNRKGEVVARIPAGTDPTTPQVVEIIEKELATK